MNEFTFDGQRANEEVIYFSHQHPWTLVKTGIIDVFLALIILAVFYQFGVSAFSLVVAAAAVIIGLSLTFNKLFVYKNTFFVLSDQRIINIDQSSIFGRKVQETELYNIYNISYSNKGVFKSLLNFGDVELTTQGDVNDRIILKNLPVPHEVFEKISKTRNRLVEAKSTSGQAILR